RIGGNDQIERAIAGAVGGKEIPRADGLVGCPLTRGVEDSFEAGFDLSGGGTYSLCGRSDARIFGRRRGGSKSQQATVGAGRLIFRVDGFPERRQGKEESPAARGFGKVAEKSEGSDAIAGTAFKLEVFGKFAEAGVERHAERFVSEIRLSSVAALVRVGGTGGWARLSKRSQFGADASECALVDRGEGIGGDLGEAGEEFLLLAGGDLLPGRAVLAL